MSRVGAQGSRKRLCRGAFRAMGAGRFTISLLLAAALTVHSGGAVREHADGTVALKGGLAFAGGSMPPSVDLSGIASAAEREANRDNEGGSELEGGLHVVTSTLDKFTKNIKFLSRALGSRLAGVNVPQSEVTSPTNVLGGAGQVTHPSKVSNLTAITTNATDGVSDVKGNRWWPKYTYECPEATTDTMRMVDCTMKGCRLEVKFENEWGTVCSAGWHTENAPGLCRAFGFPQGGVTVRDVGGGKGQVWLEDVACSGAEGDVGDCAHPEWGKTTDCTHAEDVGLCCFGGPEPEIAPMERVGPSSYSRCPAAETPTMRLVDCNREVCRLEILHENEWGTVCDNGFTFTSADTTCHIMGFEDGGTFKQMCATQGLRGGCAANRDGSGRIWLDHVVCHGYERDLEGCRRLAWGKYQRCRHDEDVGVCCKGRQTQPPVPSECQGGELSWDFGASRFASITGGPNLTPLYGGVIEGNAGFKFDAGQGLGVDPSGCIGAETYSIYMRVKFKSTSGWKDLFRSNGWGTDGLYVNNNLLMSPEDSGIECDEPIKPGIFYQYVMSRASDGTITLYINGAECATGRPVEMGGFDFKLNPHSMVFLTDNGLRDGAGMATSIRAFNRVLSDDEVAVMCSCTVPPKGTACDHTIVVNSYPQGTIFSSVRAGGESGLGMGHSAGRLDSPQAWSPGSASAGQWMQYDTGRLGTILGVVMQGRADQREWVKEFRVDISSDGIEWLHVGCGRVFQASFDQESKVKILFREPLKGRYLKIYPTEWQTWPSMRAGAIVCERPCEGGQLDYDFQLALTSRTRGPALNPYWGEGDFAVQSASGGISTYEYKFRKGKGLILDQSRCMHASTAWTILMNVRLDDTVGYRRLLSSMGWEDHGLYVNKNLQLTPRNARMRCSEVINPGSYYKFVMSRSAEGEVKLYINGDVCAKGTPPYLEHYQLHPNNTVLFHDDIGDDSAGAIKNLHMWNNALSDEDVAQVCGCRLAEDGKPCELQVIFNVPVSLMSFSSTRNGDRSGSGFAAGRLNSARAWLPATTGPGQYLELDLMVNQSVSGVVTQGRKDQPEWVTSFTVSVSLDRVTWYQVGCGMRFEGNGDRNGKKKTHFTRPVHAKYVRIYPVTWEGAPAMRAGALLCEKPCINGELDYRFEGGYASASGGPSLDPAWGDGSFEGTGEDEHYDFAAGQGFELNPSRCFTGEDKAYTVVMRIKLSTVSDYRALLTSNGWASAGLYIRNGLLQLAPSGANTVCENDLIAANKWVYVAMSRDDTGRVTLFVNGYPCASSDVPFLDHYALSSVNLELLRDEYDRNAGGSVKRITFYHRQLSNAQVSEECECKLPEFGDACDTEVILNVVYSQMSASSIFGSGGAIGQEFGRGRLNSRGAWRPSGTTSGKEYLQMDTGTMQALAGVATQGRRDGSEWVKTFSVKTSLDGADWKDVECGRHFKGNTDQSTKVMVKFRDPVKARYVRIYPQTWQGMPSMRAGVLVCEQPCRGGKLEYDLTQGSLLSTTDGPSLVTPWAEGYFEGSLGYRFERGGGFTLDQDEDGCMNDHVSKPLVINTAYTIIMTLSLDETNHFVRLIGSTGWGDNGLYVNQKLMFVPQGTGMSCSHNIVAGRTYTFGLTRTQTGQLALYINGAQCFKGSTMAQKSFELDQHNVDFFHDDGTENSPGYVQKIRFLSKALSEGQMAADAGCIMPPEGLTCPRHIHLRPQDAQLLFSSTFMDDKVGTGYARGRLNSPLGWVPKSNTGVQWMQIDSGEEQSIMGLVTQGRRDAAWWVTSLWVNVSNDGVQWTPVECGVPFAANSDQNSKAEIIFRKPVRARYVRIVPDAWSGGISMRAALIVCERKCVGEKLEYPFMDSLLSESKGPTLDTPWGEGKIIAGTGGYRFESGQGLVLDQSACITSPKTWTILMNLALDDTNTRTALLRSDGWGQYGLYVEGGKLQMRPSASDMSCRELMLPGAYYKVVITRADSGRVSLYLNGLQCSTAVPPYVHQFLPSDTGLTFLRNDEGGGSGGVLKELNMWALLYSAESVANMCGCKLASLGTKCDSLVVMNVPYDHFTYSSVRNGDSAGSGYATPRLASPKGWCPAAAAIGQWLQLDTGAVQSVSGVVMQGRNDAQNWVTSFKVMASHDGSLWDDVQCGEMFSIRPADQGQRVQTLFDNPVVARYLRVFPQGWTGYPCMRLGALICEQQCKDHEVDYKFESDLDSVTKGPQLTADWGEGYFSNGYHFASGKGLTLAERACVSTKDYTVLMKLAVSITSGYRRLFNSPKWGDFGFYILDGRFMVYPPAAQMSCSEVIVPNQINQFGITRSSTGDVAIYLNGYRCAEGRPEWADGYQLGSDMIFMRDEGSENTAGILQRLRVWSRPLTGDEMSLAMGCQPYRRFGAKCARSITFNAPYSKITYSSVWDQHLVGTGYAQGRLNSPDAWCAARNVVGEWMQIDTGAVSTVAGVVTQGRPGLGWVAAYRISVSDDGKDWSEIECGRVFLANVDNSHEAVSMFDKPVIARYVRIVVRQWVRHIEMRAGLIMCEQACQNSSLDYRFRGDLDSETKGPTLEPRWGEGRFDSSRGYVFAAGQGLFLDEEACIANPKVWSMLISVSLDKVTGWNHIMSSGFWGDYGLFVHDGQFLLFPRAANMQCVQPVFAGPVYDFGMTRDESGQVTIYMNGFKCATGSPPLARKFELDQADILFMHNEGSLNTGGALSRIRVWAQTLTQREMASESGCVAPKLADEQCDDTIILNQPYSKISYSTVWGKQKSGEGHGTGRLNGIQGWSSEINDQNQWMKIDLGEVQAISGVITQGRRSRNYKGTTVGNYGVHSQWVTRYKVDVSLDGTSWVPVQCGLEFIGNDDNDSRVKRLFEKAVMARYVRIRPTAWSQSITMRAAVLVCAKECKGNRLDYGLKDALTSTTDGPALVAFGATGDFDNEEAGGLGAYCAAQHGQCRCAGKVNYCAHGKCYSKVSTDLIACTDEVFGDPYWGQQKHCYCEAAGYAYERGSGLSLSEGKCIGEGKQYTIVIQAVLYSADLWNTLVQCDSWGQGGLFVHENRYQLLPDDFNMFCDAKIIGGQLNTYGVTRDDMGTVHLYLNGHECAQGTVEAMDAFSLKKCPKLALFADKTNTKRDNAGVARRVAVWNRALTAAEMQQEAGCAAPTAATGVCENEMVRTLSYKDFKMSSILSNYQVGTVWGMARLDATYSWIAANNNVGEWLQMDSGSIQTIKGVVTQGRGDAGWWTTSFYARVSDDGETWKDVECGRRFDANVNYQTRVTTEFSPPVFSRYVRLYPQTWVGYPCMRAGLITCQTKCSKQHLSYELDGVLSSGTGGPSLEAPWGSNNFYGLSQGMQFQGGKGLTLNDASECLGDGQAWSVLMDVKLDNPAKPAGLMTSDGWYDDGLVVRDKLLQMNPSELICPEEIRNDYYYKYGVTRSSDGMVSVFLNGFACAQGSPPYRDNYRLKTSLVTFLRLAGNDFNGNGYVRNIQVWGKFLTTDEMAEEAGCKLPTAVGQCDKITTRNVAYSEIRVSSSYGDNQVGTGWARGQLNSPMCWVPQHWYWNTNSRTQYIQLDLGQVEPVSGIATQGCGNPSYYGWFTTSYKVQVSDDQKAWKDVECGRIFPAGKDAANRHEELFKTPVKARFVRVYPHDFSGTPALRVGVVTCEHACEGKELDYTMKSGFSSSKGGPAMTAPWGEGSFEGDYYRFAKGQGLEVPEMTCLKDSKGFTFIIKMMLDNVNGWKAIMTTPAWKGFGLCINDGVLQMRSSPKLVCAGEKIRAGYTYTVGLTRSDEGSLALYINGFQCAVATSTLAEGFKLQPGKQGSMILMKGANGDEESSGYVYSVRVWGEGLPEADMVDKSGCDGLSSTKSECDGMLTVSVPYSSYKASQTWANIPITATDCGDPRLDSSSAWCAGSNRVGEWLQLDLGKEQTVGGVVTQARSNAWQWVTTYKVKVSKDGSTWRDVECGRIFDGNTDLNTKVKNMFVKPIVTRYIRFYPQTWYSHISMRIGAVVCESKCESKHLDYTFDQSLNSVTDGPSLETSWGAGTLNSDKTYQFYGGRGLQLDQHTCFTSNSAYSVLMHVRITSLDQWKVIFTTRDWIGTGLYIHDGKIGIRTTDIECPEKLQNQYDYYIGMTRDSDGLVRLYLNGFPCASGTTNSFVLPSDNMEFMHSEKSEQCPSGYLRRLQVWGTTIDSDKMAEQSKCSLAAIGTPCKGGTVETVVPYSQMSASSVWYSWSPYNYQIGTGWGEGQLDSRAAWISNSWGKESWLQLDTGKVQTISGVVTQGAGRNRGWWGYPYDRYYVTEFRVKVSEDGVKWQWVECGRIFDGNTDTETHLLTKFSQPLRARYVQILPHAWYWGPALRAGVLLCEAECENSQLSYDLRRGMVSTTRGPSLQAIGGGQITNDGFTYGDAQGLSLEKPGICLGEKGEEWSAMVRIRLSDVSGVKGLITSLGGAGWGEGGLYVDKYLRLRPSNVVCDTEEIKANKWYWVGMTRDKQGTDKLWLDGYLCATGQPTTGDGFKLVGGLAIGKGKDADQSSPGMIEAVRLWGKALTSKEVAEVTSCSPAPTAYQDCQNTAIRTVSYEKQSASSTLSGYRNQGMDDHSRGKLNSRSAWIAGRNEIGQWLQFDLGEATVVRGVATQGRRTADQWVASYSVQVSEDGTAWFKVECGREFPGNSDRTTTVKNLFQQPVKARYVRFVVQSWNSYAAMRAGVIVCEQPCQLGHLDYRMADTQSDTGGPPLDTPWGEGYFINGKVAKGIDFPHNDIRYVNVPTSECKQLCEKDEDCVAYNEYVSGRGCYLKRALGNFGYNNDINFVFMTDKTYYKNYAKVGYMVTDGQGVMVSAVSCLGKKGNTWSILIDALITTVSGMRRIVTCSSWGDGGGYVKDGKWGIYPFSGTGLVCEEDIESDRAYRFGLTRDEAGKVRIYLNGNLCTSATPMQNKGLMLGTDGVSFLHDDNANYRSDGYIRRIQMWDRALTLTEMGDVSGCIKPVTAKEVCPESDLYAPASADVTYSEIPYGQADLRSARRLDARETWIASTNGLLKGLQWMQIDLKQSRSIAGVTVQGHHDNQWQVRSMRVFVSDDSKDWLPVECARRFDLPLQGSRSGKATIIFALPVIARFVRLSPVMYHGLPAMRAQLKICKPPPTPVVVVENQAMPTTGAPAPQTTSATGARKARSSSSTGALAERKSISSILTGSQDMDGAMQQKMAERFHDEAVAKLEAEATKGGLGEDGERGERQGGAGASAKSSGHSIKKVVEKVLKGQRKTSQKRKASQKQASQELGSLKKKKASLEDMIAKLF